MKRVLTGWLIRVLAAIALAFVVAGWFTHRFAHRGYQPGDLPTLCAGARDDGTKYVVAIFRDDHSTWYYPTTMQYDENHPALRDQQSRLPQRVIKTMRVSPDDKGQWTTYGWPFRIAAFYSTGTPPNVFVYDGAEWERYKVRLGVLDLGPVKIATRPELPGFLVLILSLLASIVGLETAVRMPAKIRRKRRRNRDLCVVCGYDLTGVQGVCPECGGER